MTSSTSIAATGMTAAAVTYAPTEIGIIAAVIGAALSVWTAAARSELSARALFGLLGTFSTSVSVGLVGAAAVQIIGPQYALLQPIAGLPDWVLSLALAGGAQVILPLVAALLKRKSDAA